MRYAAALLLIAAPPLASAQDVTSAPTSALTVRRQLAPLLEKKDVAASLAHLRLLAEMGYSLSKPSQDAFATFVDPATMAVISQHFADNKIALTNSKPERMLPTDLKLVEGIAFDRQTKTRYFTTVVGRALWREQKGNLSVVKLPATAGSLFGLALDSKRRTLWIASGAVEQTPDPEGAFKGLIGLDLSGRNAPILAPMPDGGSPADILVDGGGNLFTADGMNGGVYRCSAPCRSMTVLVKPGQVRGPQGMAISGDGKSLIIAGYGTGLWRIGLGDGQLFPVRSAVPVMLDGIDGVVPHHGAFYAIQNGTSPRRIVKITLSNDGGTIKHLKVLERIPVGAGEPSLGTIEGKRLTYVADAQWENWAAGGKPVAGATLRPTAIRSLALD